MGTYYVSGIWTTNDVITHVNAHEVRDSTVSKANKLTVNQVVAGMQQHEFYTANWIYSTGKWSRGAKIHPVQEGGQIYLRSNHDNRQNDNLDNMLPMGNLGC